MVFLDEAGDHSLDPVDKDFPVFVLVFVLCEEDDYSDVIVPAFTRFKIAHFGHEGAILHSRDIRKALGDFSFLQDSQRREAFHARLNQLVLSAPFEVIAIGIHKEQHKERHGSSSRNPYDLALELGMKRLKPYLRELRQRSVMLLAEARGKNEDNTLRLSFLQLLAQSSSNQKEADVEFELKFVAKKANVLGHQLADLCAYPIARHIIDQRTSSRAFDIVRSKFLERPGGRLSFEILP